MYFLQCAFDLKKIFSVCHVLLVLTIQNSKKELWICRQNLKGNIVYMYFILMFVEYEEHGILDLIHGVYF